MTETKPTKQTYRIRNWAEYNAALIQRGSFTLWLDEAMIERWYNAEKSGQRGASNTYSDLAIQCALTLKAVYRLPLRATQGFLASLLHLMQVPLTPPLLTAPVAAGRQRWTCAFLARRAQRRAIWWWTPRV